MVASLQVGAASPPFGLCKGRIQLFLQKKVRFLCSGPPCWGYWCPAPAGRGVLLSWWNLVRTGCALAGQAVQIHIGAACGPWRVLRQAWLPRHSEALQALLGWLRRLNRLSAPIALRLLRFHSEHGWPTRSALPGPGSWASSCQLWVCSRPAVVGAYRAQEEEMHRN